MKSVKLFYLKGCPYCAKAMKALEELKHQKEYEEVPIEKIEESEQPQIADSYDYYHVPSVFVDEKKAFETEPGDDYETIRANLKKALDNARA